MTEPRRDAGTESETPPERIDRRRLLSRGLVFGAGLVAGAAATGVGVAIWPSDDEEDKIVTVGSLPEVQRRIEKAKAPIYLDGPNVYVASFPLAKVESARRVYPERVLTGMQFGLVALLARCTHLGCRLPFCQSSGWFECPCHGAKFDGVGERRGGPAPRGLDHHPLRVDGDLIVTEDTGVLLAGAPFGSDTTEASPSGPPCV